MFWVGFGIGVGAGTVVGIVGLALFICYGVVGKDEDYPKEK